MKHPVQLKRWLLLGAILVSLIGGIYVNAQSSASTNFVIRIDPVFKLSAFAYPSPVSLNLGPSFTGAAVTPSANSNMYLRLTSVAPADPTHRITAQLTTNAPAGTILKVIASVPTLPPAQGFFGTAISPAITLLTNPATTLIDGIKACYSGNGNSDGYHLTFTWYPDYANYALIRASSTPTTIEVKFTLASSM